MRVGFRGIDSRSAVSPVKVTVAAPAPAALPVPQVPARKIQTVFQKAPNVHAAADALLKGHKAGGQKRPAAVAEKPRVHTPSMTVDDCFSGIIASPKISDLNRYRLREFFSSLGNKPHFTAREIHVLKLLTVFVASVCSKGLNIEKSLDLLEEVHPVSPEDAQRCLRQIAYFFPSLSSDSLERIHQTDRDKPVLAQTAKDLTAALREWK